MSADVNMRLTIRLQELLDEELPGFATASNPEHTAAGMHVLANATAAVLAGVDARLGTVMGDMVYTQWQAKVVRSREAIGALVRKELAH